MFVHKPVRFVTRPTLCLERGPPPRPPWRKGYGMYCIKATCVLLDSDSGAVMARVVGYDRYMHIQDSVANACRLTADGMRDGGRRRVVCDDPQVTLMSDYRKECSGQLYFVVDGTSHRIV